MLDKGKAAAAVREAVAQAGTLMTVSLVLSGLALVVAAAALVMASRRKPG